MLAVYPLQWTEKIEHWLNREYPSRRAHRIEAQILALVHELSATNRCWPPQVEIAHRFGCSEGGVFKAKRKLIAQGLITQTTEACEPPPGGWVPREQEYVRLVNPLFVLALGDPTFPLTIELEHQDCTRLIAILEQSEDPSVLEIAAALKRLLVAASIDREGQQSLDL